MKLFGPNSETALIAEDDDSGIDTNARIAVQLIAGEYFVQVRHYNPASAMGKYSIKVVKSRWTRLNAEIVHAERFTEFAKADNRHKHHHGKSKIL